MHKGKTSPYITRMELYFENNGKISPYDKTLI